MMLLGLDLTLLTTGLLALLSLVELGLAGRVATRFSRYYSVPSVSFLIFCSVWSLLALAYLALAPRLAPQLVFHQFVPAAVLAVTTIFWFAGAVAAADFLGVPHCTQSFCRTWQAAVVFAFFIWILFTGLTVFEALALRKGHANRETREDPASKLQTQPASAPLPPV